MSQPIPFPRYFTLKNGQQVLIREAERPDAEVMINYIHQIAGETNYLSFGVGEFNVTLYDEERIIDAHRRAANRIFLLAILDDEIVGMLNVIANDKPRMRHIGEFGISVGKNYWGIGVGNALMQSLLDWAKHTQIIRKLNLKVQTDNEKAMSLYRKFGFEQEGMIRRDSYIDGIFHDTYAMGILID